MEPVAAILNGAYQQQMKNGATWLPIMMARSTDLSRVGG
jgi:hypothetical protein